MAIERIGVLGAGTMGSGIAQVAAQSGRGVVLFDVTADLAEAGASRIRGFWDRGVEKGKMTEAERAAADARLTVTSSLDDLSACELAIEAAPENLEIKQRLFEDLHRICPPHALLATNTSSLSVSLLAAASGRPDRVAGMHFFNPAPLMPLVEVVRGAETSSETVESLTELAADMGKDPVVCSDTPGFIVNRVARNFYGEALRLVGEGVATCADVDAVVEHAGFRMGPFALMDLIGIDVNYAVTCSVWEATFHEPRFRPHPIQRGMVERGRLGHKTGAGFYEYGTDGELQRLGPSESAQAEMKQMGEGGPEGAARWLAGAAQRLDAADLILPRILGMLMNEAAFAVGDGVATRADIDKAMRLGTNWPAGPLEWAEMTGLAPLAGLLHALQGATGEERYRTAPLLRRLLDSAAKTYPTP